MADHLNREDSEKDDEIGRAADEDVNVAGDEADEFDDDDETDDDEDMEDVDEGE